MMNTDGAAAMREYQEIGTRTQVEDASPHRLIQLMMERVLTKLAMARGFIEQDDIPRKGEMIGDAISIINGLQVSLNHKADGKIAGNFDALYDYMNRRLLRANLDNDTEILQEVAGLMSELKEAWDAIADRVNDETTVNRAG